MLLYNQQMQKKSKWISYYPDSAHQLSAPAFSCLCLSSVYCVTHSSNDWWKQQQKQQGRAVMVRGGCELQRIRYVSFHLWVLKICRYKLVGSPSDGCIEHQKKLLTGRRVQYWKGLPREVVQSPYLDVFTTWLDKVTADLLGAGNSSVLSGMFDYRLQGSLLSNILWFYKSLGSQSWADKPCFRRTL